MTMVDNCQGHIHRHSNKPGITFAFFLQLGRKKRTPCTNTFMILAKGPEIMCFVQD